MPEIPKPAEVVRPPQLPEQLSIPVGEIERRMATSIGQTVGLPNPGILADQTFEALAQMQVPGPAKPEDLATSVGQAWQEIKRPESSAAGLARRVGELKMRLEFQGLNKEETTRLQQELAELEEELKVALGEARAVRKEQALHGEEIQTSEEKREKIWQHELNEINPDTKKPYTEEELNKLRTVTAQDYEEVVGETITVKGKEKKVGLVNATHQDASSYDEHQKAQERILDPNDEVGKKYQQAIVQGIVRPDAIAAQMRRELKTDETIPAKVKSIDQIKDVVTQELDRLKAKELTILSVEQFGKQHFLSETEAANVSWAINLFVDTYHQAFPDISPQAVAELAIDNVRLLAYQVVRDKYVFSGSDHGDLHLLQGDLKHGLAMIESLEKQGIKLKAQEKVAWMQAVFIHDIGYTVGVAQAPYSFEASKDHPIFSASFIDANKDYFIERYGQAGYKSIRETVLNHSYHNRDFDEKAVNEDGFHQELTNEALAIPDAIDTTNRTKCSLFFRNPKALVELQKIQLYVQLAGAKYDDPKIVQQKIAAYVETGKQRLNLIADEEPNEQRRAGYKQAIERQFDQVTAEKTLGQFVGVLEGVEMIQTADGRFIPEVRMNVSTVQAILTEVFGDKIAVEGFVKAMTDLGVPATLYQDLAKNISQYRQANTPEEKEAVKAKLTIETEAARFIFNPETSLEKEADYLTVFMNLEQQTLRGELRILTEALTSKENQTPTRITELTQSLLQSALAKDASLEDMSQIIKLIDDVERFPSASEADVGAILTRVNSLVTQKELDFLEVDEI